MILSIRVFSTGNATTFGTIKVSQHISARAGCALYAAGIITTDAVHHAREPRTNVDVSIVARWRTRPRIRLMVRLPPGPNAPSMLIVMMR